MPSFRRPLRYILPVAYGLYLTLGPGPTPVKFVPIAGAGVGWLAMFCAALMWRTRLWAIAPGLWVIRIAILHGAVDWTMWVEHTATIQTVFPLFLIGVSSAYRRLPSPVRNAPGTIVPNADGVGALLALPIVLVLSLLGKSTALLVLAVVFGGYRAIEYGLRGELASRGRGWFAFLGGALVLAAYAFYWARPDHALAWVYAAPGGVAVGVVCWAIQRAVVPWRNPSTVP